MTDNNSSGCSGEAGFMIIVIVVLGLGLLLSWLNDKPKPKEVPKQPIIVKNYITVQPGKTEFVYRNISTEVKK